MSKYRANDPPWKPPDPRWETTQVQSRAGDNVTVRGLGDATRWGASYELNITTANGAVQSEQLLRVQVEDGLPRQWQMAGTLQLPAILMPGGGGPGLVNPVMIVEMGAGQAKLTHRLLLKAMTTIALGSTVYQTFFSNLQELRPWLMGGGLTGLQLSVSIDTSWALLATLPVKMKWTGAIAPITTIPG